MIERIAQTPLSRLLPRALVAAFVAFGLLYVLVISTQSSGVGGNWRTTNFGSAIHDPASFVRILLDGITFAGLLFIVASGFSLIFGLMRVVNMAHGAFYLFAGFIAFEVQQSMSSGQGFAIPSNEVNTWQWIVPMIVAAGVVSLVGLLMQQLLLRWNQGQDLRQALITIAVSVILVDQVVAHFPRHVPPGFQPGGGNVVNITWPGWTNTFVDLHVWGVKYSLARLCILFLGVTVGVALWMWLYRTKTGMIIRAGVDDRQMTSALGINIQRTFAIAFVVGTGLAAVGATVGGSQSGIVQGQDGQWLLNALVVVIIGGMGSLLGAAAGSLLYGLVFAFSAAYLPVIGNGCCSQYSVVSTFILLALVLAFRPQGLFGRAG